MMKTILSFLLVLTISTVYGQKNLSNSRDILIAGSVYEESELGSVPVENVEVTVRDNRNRKIEGALTDSDGSYVITIDRKYHSETLLIKFSYEGNYQNVPNIIQKPPHNTKVEIKSTKLIRKKPRDEVHVTQIVRLREKMQNEIKYLKKEIEKAKQNLQNEKKKLEQENQIMSDLYSSLENDYKHLKRQLESSQLYISQLENYIDQQKLLKRKIDSVYVKKFNVYTTSDERTKKGNIPYKKTNAFKDWARTMIELDLENIKGIQIEEEDKLDLEIKIIHVSSGEILPYNSSNETYTLSYKEKQKPIAYKNRRSKDKFKSDPNFMVIITLKSEIPYEITKKRISLSLEE